MITSTSATYRQLVYIIGIRLKDNPDANYTVKELFIMLNSEKKKSSIRGILASYPRLFKKIRIGRDPRLGCTMSYTLSKDGINYFNWLEPRYDPITNMTYIDQLKAKDNEIVIQDGIKKLLGKE